MSKVSKKKIAITGTIGSGKSTVSKYIEKQYPLINSDQVVSDMYLDKDFSKRVNRDFFNTESETVDKAKLADLIFHDKQKKERLEAMIHPHVKTLIKDFLENQKGMVFAEVPLLYEASFEDLFDRVILVVADEDVIIKRLINDRDYSEEAARSRISNQLSVEEKIKKSDYHIYNNGSLDDLNDKIEMVLKEIEESD